MGSDTQGNLYSDDGTIFMKAAHNIQSITIKSSVQTIFGQEKVDYAFMQCSETITEVEFEPNSELLEIKPYAFYQCKLLSKIDFSNCNKLISLGDYSFNGCVSILNIELPNSINFIGKFCFDYCGITSIHFPLSLETISECSFAHCYNLTEYTIDSNSALTSINANCFTSCSSLKKVILTPKITYFNPICVWNVNSIEEIIINGTGNPNYKTINGILYNNDETILIYFPSNYQKQFTFPDNCSKISTFAFAGLNRNTIELSETIKEIGYSAFWASKIKYITIPKSIEKLNTWIFVSCSSLSNCTFLCDLLEIPERTFSGCNFSTYDVPDGIEIIGNMCFIQNTNLKKVTLPTTIKTIGSGAFSSCHKDLVLQFRGNTTIYIDDQMLIMDIGNTTISNYISSEENAEINVPSTVRTIQMYSFYQTKNLKKIIFEEDSELTEIHGYAFYECTNLEEVSFMPSIKIINEFAFYNCQNLNTISVGENITSIKQSCFKGCSKLAKFEMKKECDNLTISNDCFSDCFQLTDVIIKNGITSIDTYCFYNCISLTTITFPPSLIHIGANAFSYSGLQNCIFDDVSKLEEISSYSFFNCHNLSQFNFPESLQIIGRYTFQGTSLEYITLPKNTMTLEEGCFKSCYSLKKFVIPDNSKLTDIGFGVFEDCPNFAEIVSSSNNNFVIENTALFNKERTDFVVLPPASAVKFFYFPQTLRVVRQKALFGCHNIIIVTIPDNSVETIEPYAFQNCINLDRINFPESIKSIGTDAFLNCKNLRCGVINDITNETVITNLFNLGKLHQTAFHKCSQINTCRKNIRSCSSTSYLYTHIFLLSFK